MEILLYIVGVLACVAMFGMNKQASEVASIDFLLVLIVAILSFGLASIISVLKNIESKIRRRRDG